VTNDIKNLLSRFGATVEDYLEFDDVREYRAPPRVERPPPDVTRASPRAEGRVYIAAAPEAVVAVPVAVVQLEAIGNASNSDARRSHAGTYGHAS